MDQYILFFVSLCFSLFFTSCKRSGESLVEKHSDHKFIAEDSSIKGNSLVPVDIEFFKSEEGLPFDSIMNKVSYIKLETTVNNLIGEVNQIVFAKDRIIVMDMFVSKTITVYDMQGKFQNKIGRIGQGPEEYVSLSYITLTPDSSQVVITDMGSQSIKYYTINGNFVKSDRLPFWFSSCDFISNEIISGYFSGGNMIHSELNSTLIVSDLKGKVIYSDYPSYYSNKFFSSTSMPLRKFNNNVFFNPSYNDTVFQLTTNGLFPKYKINLVGYSPLKIYNGITNDELDEQKKKQPFFAGDIIELKNTAIFSIFGSKPGWVPFFVYSKEKKTTYMCNGVLYNPLFYFFGTPIARYGDNTAVSVGSPNLILHLTPELYRLGKKWEIDNLLNGLTEDSNPVLFFYDVSI